MSARGERRTTAQFDGHWLAAQLQALLGPLARRRLCLGLSGGLDSTVLLSALAPLRARERFQLRALHVNHGLHVNAAQWAQRAAAQARRLRVRFELLPVEVRPMRGASLEARAREARYAALRAGLSPGEVLLTAHHLDDQLETLLLALLRGSGLKGLACMPQLAPFGPGLHARPLLPIARAQLEAYAHAQGLSWSEDESNADERFDRNYLRRQVIPAIRLRWPAAAAGASRSASLLAEAQRLLEQAAQPMLAQAIDGAALRVPVLRRLQVPQRRLLLRTWLTQRGLPMPDQRRLQELSGPVLAARADAQPQVHWPGVIVRRHADRLSASATEASAAAGASDGGAHGNRLWSWRRQRWLPLGKRSAIGVVADAHGNVALDALPARLQLRFRSGGERLHEACGRVELKELLQAERIAPWQRSSVPLLLAGERIIAVADLWLDPLYRARAGSRRRGRFRWRRAED